MSEGNDQRAVNAGFCASLAGWIAATICALTFRSPQSGSELMRDGGGDSRTPIVALQLHNVVFFSDILIFCPLCPRSPDLFYIVLCVQEVVTHFI